MYNKDTAERTTTCIKTIQCLVWVMKCISSALVVQDNLKEKPNVQSDWVYIFVLCRHILVELKKSIQTQEGSSQSL